MRVAVLLLLAPVALCLSDESLFSAFSSVFQLRDGIQDRNTTVLRSALLELEKMGIDSNITNLSELPDQTTALVLMKAALGEYILGLRDPNDWTVVVADAESGQLVRQRSFSATRFAIIESLLLIAVTALVRVLWLQLK
jgi:hypothetical protein